MRSYETHFPPMYYKDTATFPNPTPHLRIAWRFKHHRDPPIAACWTHQPRYPSATAGSSAPAYKPASLGQAACGRRSRRMDLVSCRSRWRSACGPSSPGYGPRLTALNGGSHLAQKNRCLAFGGKFVWPDLVEGRQDSSCAPADAVNQRRVAQVALHWAFCHNLDVGSKMKNMIIAAALISATASPVLAQDYMGIIGGAPFYMMEVPHGSQNRELYHSQYSGPFDECIKLAQSVTAYLSLINYDPKEANDACHLAWSKDRKTGLEYKGLWNK
jgi:hypothetical protein